MENGKGKKPVKIINNNKFRNRLKKIPLDTRLFVLSEMDFVSLLTHLGLRENKSWTDEENEMLGKICEFARLHSERIINTVKKWEEDGRP